MRLRAGQPAREEETDGLTFENVLCLVGLVVRSPANEGISALGDLGPRIDLVIGSKLADVEASAVLRRVMKVLFDTSVGGGVEVRAGKWVDVVVRVGWVFVTYDGGFPEAYFFLAQGN